MIKRLHCLLTHVVLLYFLRIDGVTTGHRDVCAVPRMFRAILKGVFRASGGLHHSAAKLALDVINFVHVVNQHDLGFDVPHQLHPAHERPFPSNNEKF